MKKYLYPLLIISSLSSCKKDAEPAPSTSPIDLLTSHKWRPATGIYTFVIPSLGISQTSSAFQAICNKDDSYVFSPDKRILMDAGTTKCHPSDPQQQTGNWDLSADNQKMTFNLAVFNVDGEFTIKELTAGTLRISGLKTIGEATQTLDLTFVAK
jgi:hypothetical protein